MDQDTNQTLVALASEAQEISRLILESQGELSPEVEQRLDMNKTALMQKVDSYVFIEEQLEASAAMWKERADKCKGIADRFSKARERLRGRIKFVMDDLGTTELQGDYHRYSLVPLKPKLVITDASQLPADCMMVVTKTVPDNDKIKFMLLAGAEVPGAELEPVHALRTYGSTKGVE